MQKCPKCGYNEGLDWPGILMILAFCIVTIVGGISGVKSVQLSAAVGMFLLTASTFWRMVRQDRNRVEYLKSHPVGTERPKGN